jgi:uncharacterized protein YdaU (DUF1376 family)
MKSPAFSFYVRDWLCSKTVSKLHSKGPSKAISGYVYLLCSSWLEEPPATLPSDDAELAGLARVSMEEWLEMKPFLMPQFQSLPDGRLFNERLMAEWNKQQKRKSAGSKGGSKKASNKLAASEDEDEDGEVPVQSQLGELPTFEQAYTQTMNAGILKDFCKFVYDDWFLRGGKDASGQAVPWLGYVVKRWTREGTPWRNGTHKGNQKKPEVNGSLPLWRQIEILRDQIGKHPANSGSKSYLFDKVTKEQMEELKQIRIKLRELEGT